MTEHEAENKARSLGLALDHMRKALIHVQMAHESDGHLECCEEMIRVVAQQLKRSLNEAEATEAIASMGGAHGT